LVSPTRRNRSAEVFFSYSHKDWRLRERVEVHLAALKRDGIITGWHDRRIEAGSDWKAEIDSHLNSAHVILFLVSADFINSDYCYSKEMMRALERHKSGEATTIPIILKPSDWQRTPLGALQGLPTDGKPVTRWRNRDEALLDVATGIRKALSADTPFSQPPGTSETDAASRATTSEANVAQDHIPVPVPVPVMTGFEDLDYVTGGFLAGDLVVVAARSGMGLSSFALGVALKVTQQDKRPVAIFTPEIPRIRLYQRLLCMTAGLDPRWITGKTSEGEWQLFEEAVGHFADLPLFVDESPRLAIDDIRRSCGTLTAPAELVIIDSLALMQSGNQVPIGRQLKTLAREMDVPILAVAGLSKGVDSRLSHEPLLRDLPQGDALEESADAVLFLYRDHFYNPASDRPYITDVIISKNRHGDRGRVSLGWDSKLTRLFDLKRSPRWNGGNIL